MEASSCYKISTDNTDFIRENCEQKLGILCCRRFQGATVYFVNGTRQDIDEYDVNTYCNPHSQEYDHIIQLCLVHYSKYMA